MLLQRNLDTELRKMFYLELAFSFVLSFSKILSKLHGIKCHKSIEGLKNNRTNSLFCLFHFLEFLFSPSQVHLLFPLPLTKKAQFNQIYREIGKQ